MIPIFLASTARPMLFLVALTFSPNYYVMRTSKSTKKARKTPLFRAGFFILGVQISYGLGIR
jgi:hypothetical protein